MALLRRALAHRLGGPGPGRRLVVAALSLTGLGVALSVVALPEPGALLFEDGYRIGFALTTMFLCGLTLALTPSVRWAGVGLRVERALGAVGGGGSGGPDGRPRAGRDAVKTHVTRVLSTLGVLDRVRAVVLAHRAGRSTDGELVLHGTRRAATIAR